MKVFTVLLAEIGVKMLIYQQQEKKLQLKVNILLLFVV